MLIFAACCGHYSCLRKPFDAPGRHADDSHRDRHKPCGHWRSHRHSHPGGESPPSRLKLCECAAVGYTDLADARVSEPEERMSLNAMAEMP